MPRLKVTDDDYELLTEEERIGLKEHQAEYEAEMAAEAAEIAAASAGDPEDEPKDPPAEEPADEPVEEEPDEPDDEGEPEEGEAGEEGAEEEGAEEEPPPQAAQTGAAPIVRLSEKEEARLKSIKSELRDLAQQFDDGELTAVEWRTKQEVLEDERDALKEKKALVAASEQNAVNVWYYTTIPLFMGQHPEYKEGSLRHKLLDTLVREAQTTAVIPTDPKILIDAHAAVLKEFGPVANGAAKPEPKKKKEPKPQREATPNFSAIPASDQNQVTPPNKFARLDKLNGAAYENALAKLTPSDRDYYLQFGA